MSYISWQEKFSLGIEDIDNDHKALFDLFEQFHEAYVRGQGPEELDHVFQALLDYTQYHFQREEGLMKRCGYPGLEEHHEHHEALKAQVVDYFERFKRGEEKIGDTGICLEILGFLKNWLHFHILEEDMAIRDHINSHQ